MADVMNPTSGGSRLAEHADTLKNDLTQTGQHLREGARDVAGSATEAAKRYSKQGLDYASDKASSAKKTAETYITQNPWAAIGVAAGTGLLLGMLMSSRRRG